MDCLQLDNIIKSSKNILIISHLNPDGDTLGSMCAMYSAISDNYKKKPDMLLMSKLPDVASYDRMFESKILFDKAKYTVNIDHHITNEGYANMNIISSQASSAGEVLFDIMENLNWEISLNTAKALYTAILTDTGSFRFSNTTSKALLTVSKLADIGVVPSEIYKYCYESNTKEHVQFQAHCISNAVFCNDNKIAYIIVYKKDMERYNVAEDCTEGLTEKLRAIKSVQIAFIVKQLSASSAKISMRSESVDISSVCAKFGGGGHKLAAGCLIKASAEDAAKRMLDEVTNLKL